jgi:hypothetical protein
MLVRGYNRRQAERFTSSFLAGHDQRGEPVSSKEGTSISAGERVTKMDSKSGERILDILTFLRIDYPDAAAMI